MTDPRPKVQLEPFGERDIPRLLGWVYPSEAFLIQWSGAAFVHPLNRQQLEDHAHQAGETLQIYKAISDGGPVAHIELARIERRHRRASISRVLVAPDCRGSGIGRAITRAALVIAFDQMHLHRVDLAVFDFNLPAIRCYESLGFVREGLRRHHRFVDGKYWDLIDMSILEDEWRKLL